MLQRGLGPTWPSKKDTPYIPLQLEEIADEVYSCYLAGASVTHIHVLDDERKASMDYDKFEKAVTLIRERCNIVINTTTSGGLNLTDEIRMKPFIELKPDIASFDCGSMNWAHSTTFMNSPNFLEKLGAAMKENKVKPEIEIFDGGMISNAVYYLKKVCWKPPHIFNLS